MIVIIVYRFERILDLIKDKDKDEIKALFSEEALSEAHDIGGETDRILNFFPKGIDSWEQERGNTKRYISHAVKEIESTYVYTVYADGDMPKQGGEPI